MIGVLRESLGIADMSLLATSYRFERESVNSKALQRAIARQNSRIKEDEYYADSSKEDELNARVNEIAKWSERLEEASEGRKIRREFKAVGKELELAGKALLKVRRAQLKSLLEGERIQFKEELASLGKAFYFERL